MADPGDEPRPMVYSDFVLEVQPGRGRTYPLTVRSSAGDVRATLHVPFDDQELKNRLLEIEVALLRSGGERRKVLSSDHQAVQDFGQALFETLFVADVRALYDRSREIAGNEGKGLRLKLRIEPARLAALPWEFLYDPRQGDYISLSAATPIVRDAGVTQPVRPLAISPPLRILGMIASPPDLADLDTEQERQRIETALAPLRTRGLVDLTWLAGQTWRDLQREIRRTDFHVFYFVGHGGFDPGSEEGLIALADDAGNTQHLPATELAMLLADEPSLRLVVLNSCEGARGGAQDVFSSTAAILIRRGVPAVIAMQYSISDRAAIEFAGSFYEPLADGWPIDAAVGQARQAIRIAIPGTMEWATPVLHLRAPDGVLFEVQRRQLPPEKSSSTPFGHVTEGIPPNPPYQRADAPIRTFAITVQRGSGNESPVAVEYDRGDGSYPIRREGRLRLDPGTLPHPTINASEYGRILGQALFANGIREAFSRAMHASSDRLHVQLAVEDPQLASLRWERLNAPFDEGWHPIALDQRTPFSFYVGSGSDRSVSPLNSRDLRALLVAASPTNAADYNLAPLDVAATVKTMRASLGDIPHDVLADVSDAVGPPTLDALCKLLTDRRYPLLYISCHGIVPPHSRHPELVLFLAKPDGTAGPVESSRLVNRLSILQGGHGLPHLICLSVPDSAELARNLVRDLGIPAVVAMNDRVSFETAQALWPQFVDRLRQHGEVDRALVEARAGLADRFDILTPVLYGRLRGRPLFTAAKLPTMSLGNSGDGPTPPGRSGSDRSPASAVDTGQSDGGRPLQVFLCHSSGDKSAVRALYQRLRTESVQPWLDEEDLLPGQRWQEEIPKAVRASGLILVCLSRASVTKAGYLQKEITIALDVATEQPEGTIFIIPVRLEECDVPDRLREWHWVDYFAEGGHERLMRSVRKRAADLGVRIEAGER